MRSLTRKLPLELIPLLPPVIGHSCCCCHHPSPEIFLDDPNFLTFLISIQSQVSDSDWQRLNILMAYLQGRLEKEVSGIFSLYSGRWDMPHKMKDCQNISRCSKYQAATRNYKYPLQFNTVLSDLYTFSFLICREQLCWMYQSDQMRLHWKKTNCQISVVCESKGLYFTCLLLSAGQGGCFALIVLTQGPRLTKAQHLDVPPLQYEVLGFTMSEEERARVKLWRLNASIWKCNK